MEIKRKDGSVIMTVFGDSLQNANLTYANLWGVALGGVNLQGANLQFVDLREANLQRANLQGADLREADLQGANLQGADLRGADLRWANLLGADLRNTDLRGADLRAKQKIVVIHASRNTIIAIDDAVRIGGGRMPLAEWIDRFEAFGKQNRYTEAEIREYRTYLRAIAAGMEEEI